MNPPEHAHAWALGALALATLLPALGTSVANVGLPAIAHAFHAPFPAVQAVVLAYLGAITVLVVGAGRLGDRYGRRRLLVGGALLHAGASLACAAAPTLGWLVVGRAAQGVGAAFMVVLAMAIAGAAVPPARLGRAMGLLGTTSAAGTALGPAIGGALVGAFGWPALFGVNAPLGLLAAWLAWRHLPADGGDGGPAASRGRPDVAPGRPAAAPRLRLAAFRERRLQAGFAIAAVGAAAVMAALVVGPFYLAGACGLDPARAGAVLALGPIVAALAGAPAGRLVDRLGAPRMAVAGLGAMAAGAAGLALLAGHGVAGFVAPIAVLTAGYALTQAANQADVVGGAAADRRGVAAGVLTLARNLGLVAGASLMGAVFAAAAGTPDLAAAGPAALAAGLRATFALAAALLGAAGALAAWRMTAAGSAGVAEPARAEVAPVEPAPAVAAPAPQAEVAP